MASQTSGGALDDILQDRAALENYFGIHLNSDESDLDVSLSESDWSDSGADDNDDDDVASAMEDDDDLHGPVIPPNGHSSPTSNPLPTPDSPTSPTDHHLPSEDEQTPSPTVNWQSTLSSDEDVNPPPTPDPYSPPATPASPTDLIGEKWSETLSSIHPIRPFRVASGPVHQLPQGATPMDFFSLFWEPAFFQRLADETNLYARQKTEQKPDRKWYSTTADEMRAFIGVNIIMGIDKKPTIYQYWSTDPFLGNPGIQATFTRDRFEALCRYFHLHDSEQMPQRGDPAYDPLYKVRPLIDLCQRTFLTHLEPGRDLSIDEGMIRYKGRLYFRQYMPKKPVKWGTKVWMLGEAKSGYVCTFDVYLGKSPDVKDADTALGTKVVLHLSEPFHATNRHLYFDNFFMSVDLAEELLRKGMYCYGTLRANRYPPEYKTKRGGRSQGIKLKKGELRQLQKGSMLITLWHDKQQVAVLSTNCGPNELVTVQRRTKNAPHRQDVKIPAPVSCYNQFMGGVDLSDQMRSYYHAGRSCKKWWRFIVWFLLDVSISNAFIIERLSPHDTASQSRRTHLQFRLELAKQLIGGFCDRKRKATKRKSTPQDNALSLPNVPGHREVKFSGRKRACIHCSNHGQKTPSGRTPETIFGCDRCDVHLCRSGCFLHYHTENTHT